MEIRLAYGKHGLTIRVPDDQAVVVSPVPVTAPDDEVQVVRDALAHPVSGPRLRDLVRPGQTVAISACDATRPQPRELLIPAIIEELRDTVELDAIVILVASGTHRPNVTEIESMFGPWVARNVHVICHDCRDRQSLVWCGTAGADVPVWLNRTWVEADVRITTGLVEPHFFAGFSGGPKMVAPGLAGLETVLALHDASRIGHPSATWGVIDGNPVHDDVRAIATATGVTFSIDLLINNDHKIVRAFAGELFEAHRAACEHARRVAMVPVRRRFPVVVTTCAGYPLDQNLYQAVKGMAAAAQVVEPGGLIICAAECRDGFPDHGSYRSLLESTANPTSAYFTTHADSPTQPDQWQVQIQKRIQRLAAVVMHTTYLSDGDLAKVHLRQTANIDETVAEALNAVGPTAEVCVLPEGPRAVPYLGPT